MDAPEAKPWFDAAALRRIERIGGSELLHTVVEIFLRNGPSRIQATRTALTENDRQALQAAFHTLVSTSANVGGMELYQLAVIGQSIALDAEPRQLEVIITKVEDSWARLRERLVQEVS